MISLLYKSVLLFFLVFFLQEATAKKADPVCWGTAFQTPLKYGAEMARMNPAAAEIVTDKRLPSGKAVTLKSGVSQAIDGERAEPDLVFHVNLPAIGRYEMKTFAVTDEYGAGLMKKAKNKYESLFMKIQVDDQRPTKRVIVVPWDRPLQISGKFSFKDKGQKIKIWLPRGVKLEYISLSPYSAPKVPLEAQTYVPKIKPPVTRPRLWVTGESLPQVKENLERAENKAAWEKVKKTALSPYHKNFDRSVEMSYDEKLELAAEAKAFYYLVTGDKKVGREAVQLMEGYLSTVEFGNILDVTREIGRAIFMGSEVYDWCYPLLSAPEKKTFCDNLLRLADDMEIGWPPFLQTVVNGHGNEAQVCRDLLSMSIAIYDEHPLAYQYTSYSILEKLIPMRRFEYQSPRHNQGVNYGAYRFGWEMHAAWLLKRMTGHNVFDDNIKNVPEFWLYMRSPDGQMLRDGDGFGAGQPGKPYYWTQPLTSFLSYTYSSDPIVKADFEYRGKEQVNPVLFLLLNDPKLKAATDRSALSLTKDFGPILGSMVARTGWNIAEGSDDVVAEIKGGGYNFGNHQHSDAGSVQLYYRGFQFGDLGLYKFYGTPYDLNFNKRSIAHSMMLAVDPSEKFSTYESNDGGIKLVQKNPRDSTEAKTNPLFYNGRVVSTDFGPSRLKPTFSYFSVDLKGAYSDKLSSYHRNFCFLNLERKDIPAIIILSDQMTTSNPAFKKYWQINALNLPEITNEGVILKSERDGKIGKTHLTMLIPSKEERTMEVFSGEEANSAFGLKYEVPITNQPEARGSRIMISPLKPAKENYFLTVLQVAEGGAAPLPIVHEQTEVSHVLIIGDRVVSMAKDQEPINRSFEINVKPKGRYKIVLTGMKAGQWEIRNAAGKVLSSQTVHDQKNTMFFEANEGAYHVVRQ